MPVWDRGRQLVMGSALEQPLRRLLGRPAAPMSWVAQRNAEYDAMTAQLISRVVRRDAVTVDAGANHGLILRQLVRAAPQGRHYAFEPLPHLAKRLRRVRRATVFQVALADYTGEATFHYLPDRDAESSLHDRPDRTGPRSRASWT